MGRLVGIDIRETHVRAALLRTSYRRVAVEQLLEVSVESAGSLEQALLSAALPLTQHSESLAVGIDGARAFIHRLTLPPTALKQLNEVVPFELEAHVPVDFDELVFDQRTLRREAPDAPVIVLAAAARTEHVRERIRLVERVLGREPERVGCGPLPLANLAALSPALSVAGPLALVDLGGTRTEVVLLVNGEASFARTLSRGVQGLPESAPALAAELRQSFGAWASQGGAPVQSIFLLGAGAAAPGAQEYLSHELGVAVAQLDALNVEASNPELLASIPRFAKAVALGLSLAPRPSDMNLRRGPLSYQRGYGFLKEKVPLLSGLGAAIIISFLFSTWAELRAMSREHAVLSSALGTLSQNALGEKTTKASRARSLLTEREAAIPPDPMPHMDGFDVMVELSKSIPMSITHDIEELDLERGHVRVDAVVDSTSDAQTVAAAVKSHPCTNSAKISNITQAVNSQRQKYVLEFDLKCPEDSATTKKKKKGANEPSGGGS
jgi:general secretion pathway protein L